MDTSSKTLEIVSAPEASWAEARRLVQKIRDGARAWLELGEVLEALRTEYFAPHRLTTAGPGRGKQTPHAAATVSQTDEKGWQAKVREELGISDDTARRYMAARKAYLICESVENAPDGETIDMDDGRKFPITEETRAKARELKDSMLLGTTPITRALPAVAGIFTVEGGKGKGGKSATNHGRNIWAGMTKLLTSLDAKHWRRGELDAKHDWDEAAEVWWSVLERLPDELRQVTADFIQADAARK